VPPNPIGNLAYAAFLLHDRLRGAGVSAEVGHPPLRVQADELGYMPLMLVVLLIQASEERRLRVEDLEIGGDSAAAPR
jgi:hypothetical protein